MYIRRYLRFIYYLSNLIIRTRWLKSFYINFRLLPLNKAYKLPILILGKTKIGKLDGNIFFDCPNRFGLFQVGKNMDDMPMSSLPTKISISGILVIKGYSILNKGANLTVERGAKMILGNQVMICSGVLLKATFLIEVGNNTIIASGCFILDSNMHSVRNVKTGEITRRFAPIKIGKSCWLTMNTSIMPGTIIPDFSITARNSFLNKDYSSCKEGSFFAGSPAKIITDNLQIIRDYAFENMLNQYFLGNPDKTNFFAHLGFIDEPHTVHSDFRLFK